MKAQDILALVGLAGGIKALKDRSDRLDKEKAKGEDPYAVGRAATKEELSAAKRKAAREELNREDRIGGPRSPMVDRYGNPVTTGTGGYTFTEDIPDSAVSDANFRRGMKKGGAVSASKRADGIAQRGKTRGKIV